MSFFTIDAKPPVNYPTVKLIKALGNVGPMAMSEDDAATVWSFDIGETVQTTLFHEYEDEQNVFYALENTQAILANLAKADTVSIEHGALGVIDE